MLRPAFTEEQITFALKQVEIASALPSAAARWPSEMLEEENRKLEQLVADLRLDKVMLQDALQREL